MGASSWRYYTSYRPDPEEALQELRRDVFARGEYTFGFGGFAPAGDSANRGGGLPANFGALPQQATDLFNLITQMEGPESRVVRAAMSGEFADLNAEERRAAEQLRPLLQMLQAGGLPGGDESEDEDEPRVFPPGHRPETIEELLEMVAEDGTHSVLDIEQTGDRLGFGVAAPMPQRQVARFFGTQQPTREQVEQNWGDASDGLERWQAYYLTVYRDGQPHEYAFIGCSGD
jgi:hypothetical protein